MDEELARWLAAQTAPAIERARRQLREVAGDPARSAGAAERLRKAIAEIGGAPRWTEPSADEIVELAKPRVPGRIDFYSVSAPYGELSNFAAYPISLRGKKWPTSEHFFQAMKFTNPRDQEEIRGANSPMLAAQMGRDRKRALRPDWENAKLGVMREAVEAKFRQHDDLRVLLLATADAKLVEHTENDDYWGDGGDGRGKNQLGTILMAVRTALRQG